MASINFTIPNDKIQGLVDAIKYFYPNNELNPDGSQKFTDIQWAKEHVRRYLILIEARYRETIAKNAITLSEDDTLAT